MLTNFWEALANACREDSELVSLTGDDLNGGDLRIGRARPKKVGKYPFLGFSNFDMTQGVVNSSSGIKRTLVTFEAQAEDELVAIKIADRLELLLQQSGEPQQTQYWNISNEYIKNNMTIWQRRRASEYDDDLKIWTITVLAEFKWYLKTAL